jgi:hypothetical protein
MRSRPAGPSGLFKTCRFSMTGKDVPNIEKLSLVKRCGFQGVEFKMADVPTDLSAANDLAARVDKFIAMT